MTMKYVIWTEKEVAALLAATVERWQATNVVAVTEDNYKAMLKLASDGSEDWRARKLQSHQARALIAKYKSTLEALLGEPTYAVPGYDAPLTIKEMTAEIARLASRVKELEAPVAPVVAVAAPAMPQPIRFTTPMKALMPKKRVAIAGVHDKHRHDLERDHPGVIITWVEPRDNDAQIKSKASGRIALACTHGCNGNVLHLMKNISARFEMGNGVSFVKKALGELQREYQAH